MNVKEYLDFPEEGVVRGPIIFEWIKLITLASLLSFPLSYLHSTCFATMRPFHLPMEKLILGIPSTIFSCLMLEYINSLGVQTSHAITSWSHWHVPDAQSLGSKEESVKNSRSSTHDVKY